MSERCLTPAYSDSWLSVYQGDCREVLPQIAEASVDCVITSPPYWQQRSYLPDDSSLRGHEIGQERTFSEWVATIVTICTELRRVLKPGGSIWINVGDRYAAYGGPDGARRHDWYVPRAKSRQGPRTTLLGFPEGVRRKSLLLAPYRLAIALSDAGWIIRDRIVWSKTNGLPESVRDRFSVRDEVIFRLTAERFAYFDLDAVREPYAAAAVERLARAVPTFAGTKGTAPGQPARTLRMPKVGGRKRPGDGLSHFGGEPVYDKGKNPGNVWRIPTAARTGARFGHFAMMPPGLCERPILATCPPGGVVLDPFAGTGTTAEVANRLGRRAVLIELDPSQIEAIRRRTGRPEGAVAAFRPSAVAS